MTTFSADTPPGVVADWLQIEAGLSVSTLPEVFGQPCLVAHRSARQPRLVLMPFDETWRWWARGDKAIETGTDLDQGVARLRAAIAKE